jgi:hypothetical protein
MSEKAGALRSFDEPVPLEPAELKEYDSQHVTLARAIEDANAARDTVLKVQSEMIEELERFRAAMRHELKERKRKLDLHDILLLFGLSAAAGGIAVAFHWAYSLIAVGAFLTILSLVPWFRPAVKT